MAILLSIIERVEKVLIVAPSEKQAKIIMGYVIQHIFDNEYLIAMLDYEGNKQKLKKEQSKNRITFSNGSEIYILTAEVGTVSREAKGLMGFGATMIIVDESSLIPDTMFSKILRMAGESAAGKLIQIGNPFERNHFWKAFHTDRYFKLTVGWQQALAEGRITQEFINEVREEMPPMDFQIFYDAEFPEGGSDDSVIPYEWIQKAVGRPAPEDDEVFAGVDVARFGRDKSVYLLRKGYKVAKIETNSKLDTMSLVGWLREHIDNDEPDSIAVDVVGIGAGVADRLGELGYEVDDVNAGSAPSDSEKYFNKRAELFWNLRQMFKEDKISIPNDTELIQELTELRYKYSSEKKLRIEAKDDMKKRVGRSPDKADALALSFANLSSEEPEMIIAEV